MNYTCFTNYLFVLVKQFMAGLSKRALPMVRKSPVPLKKSLIEVFAAVQD
jgi:hypothetical protein